MKRILFNNPYALLFSVLALTGCGGGGSSSGSSDTTTSPTTPIATNSAPIIKLAQQSVELQEGSIVEISYSVSDVDNDGLTVSASSNDATLTLEIDSITNQITLIGNSIESDIETQINIAVSDGKTSTVATLYVKVVEGSPVISVGTHQYDMPEFDTYAVYVEATDPQGEQLSLSISTDSNIIDIDYVESEKKLRVWSKKVEADSEYQNIEIIAVDTLGNQTIDKIQNIKIRNCFTA